MTNLNKGFHKNGLIPGKMIVIDDDGDEMLVLEAGENAFLLSVGNSMESACASWLSYGEVKRLGWQIKEEPKTVKYSNQEHWEDVKKTEEKIIEFRDWLAYNSGIDISSKYLQRILDKVKDLFGTNP